MMRWRGRTVWHRRRTARCTSPTVRKARSGGFSTRVAEETTMRAATATVLALTVCAIVHAADRAEVGFADGRIFPESITSTRNGAIYIGSLGLDSVYRAGPDSVRAEVWIAPKSHGLQSVLGVFADEPAGTLWVCTSATGGRGGA